MLRTIPSVMVIVLVAACCPLTAESAQYGLRGTVLTPDAKIDGGVVVVNGEKIEYVGPDDGRDPSVRVIDVGGIIVPGLVDLHNHTTWNSMPRWKPSKPVRNRYEWLTMSEYEKKVANPHNGIRDTYGCDQQRYGEIKALIGGATSTTGNLSKTPVNECQIGLVRDLDFASGLYGQRQTRSPFDTTCFPSRWTPKKKTSFARASTRDK